MHIYSKEKIMTYKELLVIRESLMTTHPENTNLIDHINKLITKKENAKCFDMEEYMRKYRQENLEYRDRYYKEYASKNKAELKDYHKKYDSDRRNKKSDTI